MVRIDRNYFFEFSGLPKAGKTTTVECIRHFYKRLGINIQTFSGHDRNIGIDKAYSRELNIVLACNAVIYITKNSISNSTPTIFLLDRGIFDRSVFLQLLYQRGKISHEEKEAIIKFLTLPNNCKLIDGLFVFDVEIAQSLQREYSKTLFELPGRVMNYNYLHDFKKVLNQQYRKASTLFHEVFLVDTSLQSQRETSLFVAKQIWRIIGGDADEFPIA